MKDREHLPCYSARQRATSLPNLVKRKKRATNVIINGSKASFFKGAVFRRTARSPLMRYCPCVVHIVLTSTKESSHVASDRSSIIAAMDAFIKRLKREKKLVSYFCLRTNEGVRGVLHIVAFCWEFPTKNEISEDWADIFKASIVWSTQCYGNLKSITNYLVGYLKHHDNFSYSQSKNWVYPFWRMSFGFFVSYFHPFQDALIEWNNFLRFTSNSDFNSSNVFFMVLI